MAVPDTAVAPATPAPPAAATRRRRPSRPDAAYWLYLLPGAVLFLLVIGGPLVYTGYLSLTRWSGVGDPSFIGLDNYRNLLHDDVFWTSFQNTVAMIVAMVLLPTLIGLVLAAALFDTIGRRFRPRTAAALRAAFYLPQVLPVVVAGIVWGWILRPDGAFNGLLDAVGLGALRHDWLGDPDTALPVVMAVMIWVQIGYPVVVFMAALERVDPELYEAAEIDGAGWWHRFRAITLAQIRPETFVVGLTCTIAAMKVFGPIYALTRGGPENATNVPSYFAYYTFFKKLHVGYGSAISMVLTLIIVVISVLFIRAQNRAERRDRGI
ncbi:MULTISPECIES: carbohydrate ABC transporter permease [Micromonospora]|uniref:Sugar ABC transporter permease n=1 Tax=Micromonospora solifontis TaxID=2487138 RepID=A0ABX9WAY7_9ACTN|nr:MULTISPECIES: sugar ABC transporter permease [Micromonospora]NES14984.1 sugar ABC transporter permease [Micromonospora sp. PPF5-17B]NES39132.1 sugar ABC transporter permease [Micromonospora solifontis]NES57509.1 sugar ABC transporter permease [Micromonospora sp. PPF5-6]RNL90812.1 sugar ABC transporter permease [Micromonospora solifontis]